MSSKVITIDGEKRRLTFDRKGMAKFEQMGGTMTSLREQYDLTTTRLMYIGLSTADPSIYPSLAEKIEEKAREEYGLVPLYSALVELFMEAFTEAGAGAKKELILTDD